MSTISIADLNSSLTIDLIRLVLTLIWLILVLRIIWRVEKKLDLFFKIVALAVILIAFRQTLRVFEDLQEISLKRLNFFLDIAPSVVMIIAYIVMDRLITKLDKEK